MENQQNLQNTLLEVAVVLAWLNARMLPSQIPFGHREWLSKLLEGRIARFESRLLGTDSRDLDKLAYVVAPVPEPNPLFQSEQALDALKKLIIREPKIFTTDEIRLHAGAVHGFPPEKVTSEQLAHATDQFMRRYGSIRVVDVRPRGGDHDGRTGDLNPGETPQPAKRDSIGYAGVAGDPIRRAFEEMPSAPRDVEHSPENFEPSKNGKKRGRRANHPRRAAIRSAIERHGEDWREHLPEIFADLDREEVALGDFEAMAIDLGEGETSKVLQWADLDLANGNQRRQILDTLRKYAD